MVFIVILEGVLPYFFFEKKKTPHLFRDVGF